MGRGEPGQITLGKRPVDEATRIELHRIVEELITGEDECVPLMNINYMLTDGFLSCLQGCVTIELPECMEKNESDCHGIASAPSSTGTPLLK